MTVVDQLRHKAVEERQEQGVDMASVHIGIGHQDDLIIFQFCDIKVISITFRKSAAERVDHRLDLGVCQNLVHRCLFHV